MSDNSQELRQRRYDRLLRRITRFQASQDYAVALKAAAQEVLVDNPLGSEGTPEEISETIRALLPPPQTVFTTEFFRHPVFPVTLMKDVAQLYNCLNVSPSILDQIDPEKKANSVLMTNVWLAHAYDPTLERILMVIDMYETTRIFKPLTLRMPIEPVNNRCGDEMGTARLAPASQTQVEQQAQAPSVDRREVEAIGAVGTSVRIQTLPTTDNHQEEPVGRSTSEPSRTRGDSRLVQEIDPPTPPEDRKHRVDPTKNALAVEQYFRSTKYTGDLSQSLQNTLRDYNVCAMQLELTPRQKSLFFINVFGGTARDYFFEHCRDEMTYEELFNVMKNGFDNNARQLATESELESLTLDKVMKDKDLVDVNVGLTKLADRINSLFPQMPIQSQYPKNKVRFLRKAVLEQDWAKASIAQIVTSNFSFDDLLTSLREQYQLEREIEDAKNKSSPIPSTHYQQYGRNPNPSYRGRGNRKPYNSSGSKAYRTNNQKSLNPIGKDGQRMRCSLCGSVEHFVKDCPPGASRNFVRSNLARGVPAVHLCHDLLKGIEDLGQLSSEPSAEDKAEASSDPLAEGEESPSELHIFDQISNSIGDSEQASFFDALDESIATNFISSKVAENASVSAPQLISASRMAESDFCQDV